MLLLFLLFKILIDSAAGVLFPNKSLQDRTSCGQGQLKIGNEFKNGKL